MAEKRDMKVPQSRRQIADLEVMLRNEKTEFEVNPTYSFEISFSYL